MTFKFSRAGLIALVLGVLFSLVLSLTASNYASAQAPAARATWTTARSTPSGPRAITRRHRR